MNAEKLGEAIETLLETRAERFIGTSRPSKYIDHVRKCVKELNLRTPEEAFLFGGLDAMMQDFASANQLTRPPGRSPYDVAYHEKRIERLQLWKRKWEEQGRLPLKQS
jgi:hypothetical protein